MDVRRSGTAEPRTRIAVMHLNRAGVAGFQVPAQRPGASSPPGRALATAERLLASLALPSGTKSVSSDPSAGHKLGGGPPTYPLTPELVEAYRFWRVPGDPKSVMAWLRAHPPAKSRLSESGTTGRSGETTSREATFSFPTQPGETDLEWLEVYAVAARGGGTALRASAIVEWVRPRPKGERIPGGVRSLQVTLEDPEHHLSLTRALHAPAAIQRLTTLIEGLQRASRSYGLRSQCGAIRFGPAHADLVFRGANGTTIAKVSVRECGSTEVWVRGRRQPDLSGESHLIRQIAAVLHPSVSGHAPSQ